MSEARTYISRQEMNDMNGLNIANLNKEDLNLKVRAFWFPLYDGSGIVVNGKHYTLINDEILKGLQPKGTTAMV